MFVSDVTTADLHVHLEWLRGCSINGAPELANRLAALLAEGRLLLDAHPFYTSPEALWDMPRSLREAYQAADLVVLKGDGGFIGAVCVKLTKAARCSQLSPASWRSALATRNAFCCGSFLHSKSSAGATHLQS